VVLACPDFAAAEEAVAVELVFGTVSSGGCVVGAVFDVIEVEVEAVVPPVVVLLSSSTSYQSVFSAARAMASACRSVRTASV